MSHAHLRQNVKESFLDDPVAAPQLIGQEPPDSPARPVTSIKSAIGDLLPAALESAAATLYYSL
jgi:hypothetical protein